MAIRFDPNGNTLLAFPEHADASAEPTLKFLEFDIDHRKETAYVGTHGVVDGRATADGKYIITWDGSPEIVFWDTAKHTEAAVLKVAPERVYDVAFSPSGDVIATAGDDGEVKFWKIADRKQVPTNVDYQHEGIDLIQFIGDGKLLLTGSDDGLLRQWGTPFAAWSDPQRVPIGTEFKTDGTVIEKFPDGTTVTSHKQ